MRAVSAFQHQQPQPQQQSGLGRLLRCFCGSRAREAAERGRKRSLSTLDGVGKKGAGNRSKLGGLPGQQDERAHVNVAIGPMIGGSSTQEDMEA